MARITPNRPRFFWQGALILLPVVVLSVVSLVSLREDARRAEQETSIRGGQDVQSLARAIRSSLSDELQRYLALQNEWDTALRSAGQPDANGAFPGPRLQAEIKKWQEDYPTLKFRDVAVPPAEILTDGRLIEPPDLPAVPRPPKWFRELSPGQQTLWLRLRHAVDTTQTPATTRTLMLKFLNSDPSADAKRAAQCLSESPRQIASLSSALPTETGLSFQEIACYRLLSAPDAKLTASLLQSVWWQITGHPSFASPELLKLAEGLTNQADAVLSEKFFRTQQYWNGQTKTREWMGSLRRDAETLSNWNPQKPWAHWTAGQEALALFQAGNFINMGADADGQPMTGGGYHVYFIPGQIVEAVLERALEENKVFIPNYESAIVTVEGKTLAAFPPGSNASVPSPGTATGQPGNISLDAVPALKHWQFLGTATQRTGPLVAPDALNLGVNLYLTDREQMLSAEHRRIRLTAGLILGAMFSALVGWLAAWRAFHRQLQLNDMKTNFVSSVSHELRAPIASVRLMAENLQGGKIPEANRQNEYFRFIVQECRRLSSLIENVLDFSRIEQGRKQYEFEPTNLATLVQTTVKLMEPYAAERGVRLEITPDQQSRARKQAGTPDVMSEPGYSPPPLELNVDSRAIQQALINLIDNAIKHSPKGEIVTVEIAEMRPGAERANAPDSIRHPQSTILISVMDHGPGIPREEHEKIFERFYRRGSELRRETQGVGIGLSVVKHIIEAHGGRVLVESDPGRGSRFTIELPNQK